MRFFLTVVFGLLSYCALSQSLTISGKVLDQATEEPLPFASVGIAGKSISTITNLQGEFDFHLPSEYRNEVLVISMLGYNNFEAPVWSLLGDGIQTIHMTKSTTVLNEVVVTDSLAGNDIMRIALSRIEINYPMQPFLLDGFYRDVKKVGGTYISLLEAAVKIYDENYSEPRNKARLRERVQLVEVRQSLGYENKFTPFFDQTNLLEDLLLNNDIRYRQLSPDDDLLKSMTREADSYYNGHAIYVVSHTKGFLLRFFIDKDDYSIVHMEYETTHNDEIISKRKELYSKFVGIKKIIDFKKYQDKMYLNFMTINSKINWYDINTDELKFETELYQQLLINKVQPDTRNRIGSTEKMRNYGLQYQDHPYNKKFWEDYNVIKETPLDKKVLNDLEKLAPLDKQFEN